MALKDVKKKWKLGQTLLYHKTIKKPVKCKSRHWGSVQKGLKKQIGWMAICHPANLRIGRIT